LDELIANIPPDARAMLALYCYRRAHLNSIGLAIAASCNEDYLSRWGGRAGAMLFAKSREAPQSQDDTPNSGRRKSPLSSGPPRAMAPIQEEMDREYLKGWGRAPLG